MAPSCKAIKDDNDDAPSGEYDLRTASGKFYRAYCEMGLDGGGWTFLHPSALVALTNEDLQAIYTNKSSILMRFRENNGKHSYGLLTQMGRYR